jgi:hypothetical protein
MGRHEKVGGFGGGADRMIVNERKIRTKAEALGLCQADRPGGVCQATTHQRTGWQPVGFPPLRDQEPAIVFLFTAPVSVSALPLPDPDTTLTSKWPVTLLLKSPGDPIKL